MVNINVVGLRELDAEEREADQLNQLTSVGFDFDDPGARPE